VSRIGSQFLRQWQACCLSGLLEDCSAPLPMIFRKHLCSLVAGLRLPCGHDDAKGSGAISAETLLALPRVRILTRGFAAYLT
jgi:hypothetical protein